MKRAYLTYPLAALIALVAVVTAWAFYATPGSGNDNAAGTVGTLTAPTLDDPMPSGGAVALSWSAAQLPSDSLESQITYSVERMPVGGDWGPADVDCTSISTTTCEDNPATSGSYAYRVVAEFRTWSATSDPSDPVAVTVGGGGDTQAPELDTLEMLDTNANGRVDQVQASFDEALAASTATSPWTLSNVPSAGTLSSVSTSGAVATLTLTEGAGAANTAVGSFTVALAADPAGIRDAANNQSSFAAQAPADKAAPVVTGITRTVSSPTNADSVGFTAAFSESVTGVNAGNFALATTATASALIGTVSGSAASYTVPLNTVAGDGTLGLNLVDNDSIVDLASPANALGGAGNTNGNFTGQTYTIDNTAPQLASLEMFDDDANGAIDRVDATFGEALETSGANVITGWNATNRPGGISNVSAVNVSGSSASLAFTGGSTGADSTAVGNFTVTLSSSTGQIRDAAGNRSGFSQSPTDKAGPVPRLLADTDGSTNGLFQTNDTLTVTFTEDLSASYASLASADAIVRGGTGGANDEVSLPGGDGTFMTLGRTDYISGDGSLATFTGASAARAGTNNADRPRLLITLGGTACSGACASLTQAGNVGNFTFRPDPAITDAAGNPAEGSRTQSIRLF